MELSDSPKVRFTLTDPSNPRGNY